MQKAPPAGSTPLQGRLILIVEDEYLLAMDLAVGVVAAGGTVLGPVPRIEDVANLLDAGTVIEAAILDVGVGSSTIWPIVERLLESVRDQFVS